jgi:hypothetical protein
MLQPDGIPHRGKKHKAQHLLEQQADKASQTD